MCVFYFKEERSYWSRWLSWEQKSTSAEQEWWLQIFVARFLNHLVHHLYQESDKLKKSGVQMCQLRSKTISFPSSIFNPPPKICVYIEFKNKLFQLIPIFSWQVGHCCFIQMITTTGLFILLIISKKNLSPRLPVLSFHEFPNHSSLTNFSSKLYLT